MIFVFLDDSTLDVVANVEDAQCGYEGVDVEEGSYEFFDERGRSLQPRFTKPNRTGRTLLFFRWVVSGEFELLPTPNADTERVFTRLRDVKVVNPNRWFKDVDEIERFLRDQRTRTSQSRPHL